jgi:L-fucose mutarotase/ribose pyranase (RbsD/FucU family)
MTKPRTLLATLLLLTTASFCQQSSSNWQTKLHQQLPLLGHRNWILVVDSAYPLQVSPGVEVIETGSDQLTVVSAVLTALDHSTHVKPILDAELPYVPQQSYPNLNAYREALKKTLQGRPIQSLPHEKILGRISEAGKDYKILVLKTTMTMPYTSVFFQLDCKYCTDEGEQKIRQGMKSSSPK